MSTKNKKPAIFSLAILILVPILISGLLLGGNNKNAKAITTVVTPQPTIVSTPVAEPTLQPTLQPTPTIEIKNITVENPIEVHFISTGNSDAILIKDNEKNMLIDGAENNDEKSLVGYLNSEGIKKLDYVVLTHPDADHCGGLDAIINNFSIGQIFIGNGDADTQTYKDFVQAAMDKNLKPSVPLPDQEFALGCGSFKFFNQTSKKDNANDNSLVALYTIGNNKFLFTGDSGQEVEAELPLDQIGKVDVLKVGHHGSKTSSSDEFIQSISPRYSVICCGKDNKYGHPHKETLDTLGQYQSNVYRTDMNGNIIFTSDGKLINVNTKKVNSLVNEDVINPNADIVQEAKKDIENGTVVNPTDDKSATVYVTNTGSKYHRGSCSSLRKSKISIGIDTAKAQGYEACKKCNP